MGRVFLTLIVGKDMEPEAAAGGLPNLHKEIQRRIDLGEIGKRSGASVLGSTVMRGGGLV
ncbi:hypothetical protein MAFF211271_37490 (plasmid) [Ralstonia syzygii subsp. indonesiensis]|nr:hypothetical protein MAFF211271_37490 [Ralstonia pseudosolanacearum]